ncbi:MAG: hypothetical protein RR614_13095 [Eubacterium sp.]
MGKLDNQDIILGAGEVYLYEVEGGLSEIPTEETIETEAHNVGHCSGGFSVDYKPEKYDIKNQYGTIVKSAITSEEITAKTGILRWDLQNIGLLSCAKFVHVKDNGKKIRFTMIGQGGNGFAVEFGEKELTVDAEITAISYLKDFLAEFSEEMTDEEAAEGSKPGE